MYTVNFTIYSLPLILYNNLTQYSIHSSCNRTPLFNSFYLIHCFLPPNFYSFLSFISFLVLIPFLPKIYELYACAQPATHNLLVIPSGCFLISKSKTSPLVSFFLSVSSPYQSIFLTCPNSRPLTSTSFHTSFNTFIQLTTNQCWTFPILLRQRHRPETRTVQPKGPFLTSSSRNHPRHLPKLPPRKGFGLHHLNHTTAS